MHPTVTYELARYRINEFQAQADADRRAIAARPGRDGSFSFGSRWQRPDPTGLVRRLMTRLHPVVAP